MFFLAQVLDTLISIYIWIVVVDVLVTWLIHFEVINPRTEQARNLLSLLRRATDPVMKPVQKYVPPIGGIDITPLVVIVGLQLLSRLIWSVLA